MSNYRFKIFSKRSDELWLQFYSLNNPLQERPLEGVDAFIAEVEANYHTEKLTLSQLGQRLFHWLDGPTERWLTTAYQRNPALTLHINVDGQLRHLPWELLYNNGFLCAHAYAPLSPVRRVTDHENPAIVPANRPLRLLFMASSPQGVQPVLAYEQEEAMILAATRHAVIDLEVEESGALVGLRERVDDFGPDYFDVFHLTGHADVQDDQPIFILENAYGFADRVTASALAQVFRERWPRLLFLSGCKTGQAVDQGHLPSFCEALVEAGAPAVLGWALPVGDVAASQAAAKLYAELAKGTGLDRAVAYARQHLFEEQSAYWHLLRFYGNATPLTALVTPVKTKGREKLFIRAAQAEFIDAGSKMEICARRDFVGRRRVIQRCLQVLRSPPGEANSAEGIVLQGMGGLGKSSLAGRLCERLKDYQRLVWVGQVNEAVFINRLNDRLSSAATTLLEDRSQPLKKRLVHLLTTGDFAQQAALFIFDDFEHSLEADHQRLKPDALAVLHALLLAIHETASDSRVIVTCRYQFDLAKPVSLHVEHLESLRAADLDKKLKQLDNFDTVSEALKTRAIALADGNPRLLHLLNSVLDNCTEATQDKVNDLFNQLSQTQAKFREDILLEDLMSQLAEQDPAAYRFLALLDLYQLPVSVAGVQAIAGEGALLSQAVRLSLVEAGIDPRTQAPQYYTSALLTPLVEGELSESEKAVAYQRGAEFLYQNEWVDEDIPDVAYALEIHRLAVLGKLQVIAAEIVAAIGWSWVHQSRYREVEQLCQRTLQLGDDHRILHLSAYVKQILGDTEKALIQCEKALTYCPTTTKENKEDYASIIHIQANILYQQGNVRRALSLYLQLLALVEQIGYKRGQAALTCEIAHVIAQQGKINDALNLWEKSRLIYREIDDKQGQAVTIHQIAIVFARQGDADNAIKLLKESQELFEQVNDIKSWVTTKHDIARIITVQGNIAQALILLEESLVLYESMGNAQGQATTMCNIASIFFEQGNISYASELWQKSLKIYKKIGDVRGQAGILQWLALVTVQQREDISEARKLNFESLRMLVSIRAWPEVVSLLMSTEDTTPFLLQALWLATQVYISAKQLLGLTFKLLEKLGFEHDIAPLATAYALFHLQDSPQKEELQEYAQQLLTACAQARNIEDIEAWFQQQRLNDPNYFLPTLRTHIEALVKEWVFDRALFEV